jgi:amidase
MVEPVGASELCDVGAAAQADLVCRREVSARELIDATLERIDRVDPEVNSFRVVLAAQARDAASEADRVGPDPARPLHGVPVAIKDNLDVAGEVTGWGSDANDHVSATDAPLVDRLRAAGAIVIGKTNCSELASWPIGRSESSGSVRNPWNLDFDSGGSSSGSAAAAATGMCGMAVGSDGLGSIRIPAAYCGVFGLKPQYGRVWHDPYDWGAMSANGPIALSPADAAVFLDATAVEAPPRRFTDAIDDDLPRLRIALARTAPFPFDLTARLDDDQRAALDETAALLAQLGHTVVDREVDTPTRTGSGAVIRYVTGVAECMTVIDHPERVSPRTRDLARLGRLVPSRILQSALAAQQSIRGPDQHDLRRRRRGAHSRSGPAAVSFW